MNKKTLKIAGWALGLSMAVAGIGVAVGTGAKKPIKTLADAINYAFTGDTVTFSQQSLSNDTQYSDEFSNADDINTFKVQFTGGGNDGKYYNTGTGIRTYGGGSVTVTALNSCTLTSVIFTWSASNYAAPSNNITGYTLSSSTGTWTGSASTISLTRPSGSGHWRLQSVQATVSAPSSDPDLTLSANSISMNSYETAGKTVTVIPTGFGDGEKHYVWSTSDENVTLENTNTATVTIKPNTSISGSATVNVSVWGGTVAEGDAITDSVSVSITTPNTVAQALDLSGNDNVYALGIVSEITEVSTENGNATFYISDDGTTNNQMLVYRGRYLNNTAFTSAEQIHVGDTVVVFGDVITYKETVEFGAGNYLISLISEPRLSLSSNEITLSVGAEEEITALPSNFPSGEITYEFDEDDCATLSFEDNTITVHGDKAGTHTFTVTGLAGGVEQTSATLSVTVVNPYPTTISRSGYASYTDEQTFAEGTGSVTITYSDGSKSVKHLGDDGVKLLISDAEVAVSTRASSYLGSNSAKITFTDEGQTVSTSSYTLNVSATLEVISFEDVPDYLIIDSNDPNHSAAITVNYRSLKGEADLSITSSNPTKLPVSFDEENHIYDDEAKTGMAQFTITAGSTAGQYSVTVSATCDGRTETKSFSIDVRGEAPVSGDATYNRISSLSNLENGNYVLAVDTSSSIRGMTRSLSSSKYSMTDAMTVENNQITSEDGDDISFYLTISGTGESRTATIKNNNSNNYLYYVSSTNLGEREQSYNWTVTESSGSFRFTAGSDNSRGLVARTGTTNKFGGYSLSNINGTEYFDIALFKYAAASVEATPFDLVSGFVSNYMHMNDVSLGNNNDTNACRGDSGYYLTAKRAWNAMLASYEGETDLKNVFSESFEDAYARYVAWATACNDAGPFDQQDDIVNLLGSGSIIPTLMESDSVSSFISVTTIFVTAGALAAGGLFLTRKRRNEE